jgi:alpha-2-macroglobulin
MIKLKKPGFSPRWLHILLTIIIISSLLAGCRLPWGPTPEEETLEADVTETQEKADTPEPRQDLPPALVEVSPLPDSMIALKQPFLLYFNQPMDTASVEAAIHFNPSIDGGFSWEENQILTFTPDHALPADSTLILTINTSAQAANKETLQEPIELEFQTMENLSVVQTLPADGTEDVDPASAVFTAFNQPVVPLGAESDADPAFSLSPEVPGQGEWINTSTYIFYPEPSMNGGTTYTIQLNDSLTAASGSGLAPSQELQYSFTTTQPEVINVLPLENEELSLDGPITIQFNIRMDPESVAENFDLLDPNGVSVDGNIAWDENNKKLTFTPSQALSRNAAYTIKLDEGAASYGGLSIDTAFETTRTTYPAFSTDPSQSSAFEPFYASYGQYQLYFTTPVDSEDYKDYISITPEVNSLSMFLTNQDTSLVISGYFKPETHYSLTLESGLHDSWGGELAEDVTYSFYTPQATPVLSLVTGATSNNLVFIPASASELVMQATNINTVTLEISPITINDLMTLLHPDNYDYRQVFMPENVEKTTRNLNLTPNTNEIITIPLSYQGKPLSPGVYFLGVISPDLTAADSQSYQKLYLIVSENNLVMKIAPEQALIWATRLQDNTPLNDIPVSVYNTEGDQIASGTTDEDGLFQENYDRFEEPYSNFFTVVGEPGEDNFAFSISTWGQGYSLYQRGISFNTLPVEMDAYIYTDRPLYRPRDVINFKAAVFARDNGLPAPSDLETVTVSVYSDPGMSGISTTLYQEELALNQFGTIEGSVTIPEDASPGYYRIELTQGEQAIKVLYFDVAEYRKPDIEVQIKLSASEILANENLNADIQADYYFGVPASNKSVSWALYRDDDYFSLPGYRVGPTSTNWLTPLIPGYSPLGTMVASGEGETNEQGQLNLSFTPEDMALDETAQGSPQKYTLEVTLSDETGFSVSNRESVKVHPDDFYIGVQPETYFGIAESDFSFAIQTVDLDKEDVSGISLEATFEAIEWEIEETNNPEMPYRYVPQRTPINSSSPVTDGEGQARVSFTPPEPGTYQLTLSSGNAVTQVIVWVSGPGTAVWPRQTGNQIELTLDVEEYQPGQTAEIFFPNPIGEGAKALVTIERVDIIKTQIIDLEGSGHTLQVPLDEDSIPNVYVSVILIGKNQNGDPDYRQGVVNVPVTPVNKTLNVDLTIDPEKTQPGESVEATLTITDAQGDPVQGEFSIAVVDKALLALVEPNSPSIFEALYGERPLSVQTSYSLKTYAAQLAVSTMDLGRGGGGGDMEQALSIREDFPDTAFWQAEVVTGADGTAQLTISMPDSLTTWVVDVRGLTEEYLVGQVEAEILTQKDLMIRPVTPRFLVDGDEVEMAAIVHNNTSETLEVDVSLQALGFTLSDEANQTQQVTIEAGGSARVNWWGTVESVESVSLTFKATSGSLSDATAPTWGDLQVLRYTMPYTFSTAGQLTEEGQRLELVSLPISTDPSAGALTLELTPSLTATLVEGLKALEKLPYDDTVSILSRLLANLHAYQALTQLGIDSPQLQSNLESLVNVGVHDLLSVQNVDGGWSWWAQSVNFERTSDPFITAYVLMGLKQAADAGFEAGEYATVQTYEFLSTHLADPAGIDSAWQLDRLVFQVYALRDSDLTLDTTLDSLYTRRSELSPWSIALLALTLNETNAESERVNTLLSDLENRAVRSATGVHWESDQASWMLPGTPIFNTAVGVFTLAQLDPASTSLPLALRYLMIHQNTDNFWSSTFESAWALMAITEALQGTGDYQADFDFQAILNDTVIAEGTASGTAPLTSVTTTTSIEDLYPDSPNALQIERGAGAGTLYYRADLETYQPAGSAEAVNRGINIQREYYLTGEECPNGENCEPITAIELNPNNPSQMITVALTVNLSHDMYNLMIQDFIPAGTEVLNQDFLTSQTLPEENMPIYDTRSPFADGWGWWYFNDPEIYNDHVLWTSDFVPAGTYVLTYEILPYQRGSFQVLPTHAWQYFYPEVQGTSSGDVFTIE